MKLSFLAVSIMFAGVLSAPVERACVTTDAATADDSYKDSGCTAWFPPAKKLDASEQTRADTNIPTADWLTKRDEDNFSSAPTADETYKKSPNTWWIHDGDV